MNDLQLKILKYISKRKTLATAKEIQLRLGQAVSTVSRALKTLTNKGCIKSKSVMISFVKVRQYELITMVPDDAKPEKKTCVKFAKTRITLDTKYFHNPFGINTCMMRCTISNAQATSRLTLNKWMHDLDELIRQAIENYRATTQPGSESDENRSCLGRSILARSGLECPGIRRDFTMLCPHCHTESGRS